MGSRCGGYKGRYHCYRHIISGVRVGDVKVACLILSGGTQFVPLVRCEGYRLAQGIEPTQPPGLILLQGRREGVGGGRVGALGLHVHRGDARPEVDCHMEGGGTVHPNRPVRDK